jgi:hypothetical protein
MVLQTECLHTLPPPPQSPSEPPRGPLGDPMPEPEETVEPDWKPDPDRGARLLSRPCDP